MDRVVSNEEILDRGVSADLVDGDELVRSVGFCLVQFIHSSREGKALCYSSIRSLTVPPCLAISIDNCVWIGCDCNVGSSNLDHINILVCISKCLTIPFSKAPSFHDRLLTVLPAKVTVLPVFSPDRSNVCPPGTAILLRTICLQQATA